MEWLKAKYTRDKPKGTYKSGSSNMGASAAKGATVPKGLRKRPSRAARRGKNIRRYT